MLHGKVISPVDWSNPKLRAGEIIVFTTYDYETHLRASKAREAEAIPYLLSKSDNIPGIDGDAQSIIVRRFP